MTEPADWPRTSRLFDELIDLGPVERRERLAEIAAESGALAAELERLLAADSRTDVVLDRDLAAFAARARVANNGDGGNIDEDLSGRLAGAYRLEERIGSGGMGTVYAAARADGLYEQRVAVKVLAHSSPDLLRRFARERAILATLEHPRIARLLDAGSFEQRPYLVMELVEGASLVEHCDRQGLDLPSRLRLFRAVCEAVAFAHRRLVVHRDLKPSNVLVGIGGEVKLLDFGIASLLDPEGATEPTATSSRLAFTPAYAAPEQVYGQAVTTATDVYALGALLHELLVGRPPQPIWLRGGAKGTHLTATLAGLPAADADAVATARGLDRRGLGRRLRGDLDAIVATALRHEPEERYASADALAADVARYLDGRPVASRGADRLYRARLFVRRHRRSLAASALALTGLLALLWVALAQTREARSEALRAGALRRFLNSELNRERLEQVAMGKDGPTLGYVFDHGLRDADHELAGEPAILAEIYSIAGETYRTIAATPRAVAALRIALARKRTLYGERDPRVREARFDLARTLLDSGATAETGSLLAGLERETRGQADRERCEVMTAVGEQRRWAGDLPGTEAAYREVVAITRERGTEDSVEGSNAIIRLALAHYQEGRYRESERELDQVVALGERLTKVQALLGGRQGVRRGQPVHWCFRGYARHRSGDLEGAEQAYRRALDGFAALRPASPAVGYASCGLGLLLAERGDAGPARAMLARPEVAAADTSQRMTRSFFDPGVPCPAVAAWARDDLAGFDRALAAQPAALRAATRPDRDLLRAELLLARGRAAEALPLCDGAVRDREANPELEPWRRAEAHLLRGVALCRLGRRAEGAPELSRYAAVLRERVPGHRFLRLVESDAER